MNSIFSVPFISLFSPYKKKQKKKKKENKKQKTPNKPTQIHGGYKIGKGKSDYF